MTIVTGLIGTGKTVEMIKQCAKKRLTIVVERADRARDIEGMAKKIGTEPVNAITYDEFLSRHQRCCATLKNEPCPPNCRCSGNASYFIENIEGFMAKMFGAGTVQGFICEGEDVVVTAKDDKVGFYRKDLYSL